MKINKKKFNFRRLFHSLMLFFLSLGIVIAPLTIAFSAPSGSLSTEISQYISVTDGSPTKGTTKLDNNSITLSVEDDWLGRTQSQSAIITSIKEDILLTFEIEISFENATDNTSASIDGKKYSPGLHTFNKGLNLNDTIELLAVSGDGKLGTQRSMIKIFNISITKKLSFTTTFMTPQNGSYTVNGTVLNANSEPLVLTNFSTYSYILTATPNENCDFLSWIKVLPSGKSEKISREATFTFYADADCSIYPEFSDFAQFTVGNSTFLEFKDAIDFANSSSDKLIVVSTTGKIKEGINYLIPSGVSLLIPHNETKEIIKEFPSEDLLHLTPNENVKSYSKPNIYRKLIIPTNTNIIFESKTTLGINAYISDTMSYNTYPSESVGALELQGNATIELKSGAEMFCFGYAYGEGIINARDGSIVNELFQIGDFRGGTATTGMLGKSQKVFPFSQYFVQNVECRLRIYGGAKEKLHASFNVSKLHVNTIVSFIGTDGMFKITGGSLQYIERSYDATNDFINFIVNGDVELSSIIVQISTSKIDSKDYVLPINNNMIIHVIDGTIKIEQDLALLPGSKLLLDENTSLTFGVNKSLYVYDSSDWIGKNFISANRDLVQLPYCATKNGKPVTRNPKLLEDAEILLDGSITVNNGGAMYTTLGGANVHSVKGTGNLSCTEGSGTQTITYQGVQVGTDVTYSEIPINNAKLKNDVKYEGTDLEYTLTDGFTQSVSFIYQIDKWVNTSFIATEKDITFINSKTGETYKTVYTPGKSFTFPTAQEAGFANPNEKISLWKVDQLGKFKPGYIYEKMPDLGNIEAHSIYGGWSEIEGNWHYLDPNTGNYATGLMKLESYDNTGVKIYKFSNEGRVETEFTNVYLNPLDNETYYIKNGVVQENYGLLRIFSLDQSFYYYYFGNSNTAYKNGIYYISTNTNDLLCPGYYEFDSQGRIVREYEPLEYTALPTISNDKCYIDGIAVPYGLFNEGDYYYYAKNDATIVKNETYYVSKLNGLNIINEGLYYFDELGRLCNENLNVITKGGTL